MSRSERFRLKLSDRSGFQYKKIELVKDGASWVGPDEYDEPPPSRISLGGEGDISQGVYFNASTSTAIFYENPTFYIDGNSSLSAPNESLPKTNPYMRVSGSNGAVTLSANPAINAGAVGQVLTLFCTDSSITINNGNGVSLMASRPMVMNSGSTISFIYTDSGNAWQETSRGYGIGG